MDGVLGDVSFHNTFIKNAGLIDIKLFDEISDAVIIADRNFNIHYWNQAAERLYGWAATEVNQKNISQIFGADVANEYLLAKINLLQLNEKWQGKIQHIKKQGENIVSSITASLLQNAGQETEFLFTKHTPHKENYFKTLVENASDIISVLNEKLEITFYSPSLQFLLGYNEQELLGKYALDYIHEEDSGKISRLLNETLENPGMPVLAQFRFKASKGQWKYFESVGKTFCNEEGQTYYIINSRDITARKEAESRTEGKNKEMDAFFYRSSHDLKAPVSSMRGLINIIKEETTDYNIVPYLEKLEKCNLKLELMIQDLLSITRLNHDIQSLSEVDIDAQIEEILDNLRYLPKFEGITFDIKNTYGSSFKTDGKLIHSILHNLIHNAVQYRKFPSEDARIQIYISPEGNMINLQVEDNGEGILPEVRGKIFDMFYRGSYDSEGTGLGLYIVKTSVEKLGGIIMVSSIPQVKTRFEILLPVV